jgi:hypothetical protein
MSNQQSKTQNQTKNIKVKMIRKVRLAQIAGTTRLNGQLIMNDNLCDITQALGGIYRFYRYKKVHLKLVPFYPILDSGTYSMGCTYVPADSGTNLPTTIDEIEGTTCGLFSGAVLEFQHYNINNSVLSAQNYKWWTTNGFVSTDEDDQGRIVFVTDNGFNGITLMDVTMEVDIEVQFHTFLDPALM